MGGVYGGQPMTVNFGASITPELPIFDKFVFAIDYVDALNANKLRMYDGVNPDGTVYSYTDYDENSFMKRLRMGAGMGLIDNSWFHLTANLGLYQSAYTAGLNVELLLFKLNFATYQEEIGNADTSIPDRRYMAQLGFGW